MTGARLWRCGVRNFGAAGFQLARETCDDHDPLTAAVSAPGCAFHPVELKAAIELPLAPRASAEPESLLGWVVKGNATPGATHVFRLRYTLPNAVHGLAASPYARLRLRYGNFDIVWNHFLPFFLLFFDPRCHSTRISNSERGLCRYVTAATLSLVTSSGGRHFGPTPHRCRVPCSTACPCLSRLLTGARVCNPMLCPIRVS